MVIEDVDDDFLSQIALIEAQALSSKRRKLATSPSPSAAAAAAAEEGAYTAALKGSRSVVFQHHQISFPTFKTLAVGGGGGGAVAEKVCPCGVGVCVSLTANTEKNRGRKFYKCPLREENGGCGFFEWCDKNTEADSTTVKSQSYASNNLASDLSCPCGAGACLILTAKTGKNIGQQFHRCPANQARSCGFFKWCHEHKTSGDTLSFSANASTTFKNIPISTSQNSFSKDSGSCFKCGKDGHWARDCSSSANASTNYTTGKINQKNFANSGSSCFKCGQEGHWAKDCSSSEKR